MKAKKILSMVLVGVTAIGLLAGCSSNTTDTQGSSADDAAQTESQDTAEGSAEETENQSGTDDSTDAASGDGNVLVVYYSATGNTEAAANYIADATGGDLFELEPVEPYTDEDLNYSDENSRVSQEYADESLREVELVSTEVENWDSYDTVFIGYPNWNADLPMPLYTFLEEYDLSGKTIIPFTTHGGSGFSGTIDTIQELQPNAQVVQDGLSISRNNVPDAAGEVADWVAGLGF